MPTSMLIVRDCFAPTLNRNLDITYPRKKPPLCSAKIDASSFKLASLTAAAF